MTRAAGWTARRMVAAAALAVLAAFLADALAEVIRFVPAALGYPFELDYGEGIVLQQMRNMLRGTGYAPLGVFPAIVYHYPPVYHLTVAALAHVGGLDDLVAGRVVSLLATAGAALVAGWLAARASPAAAGRRTRTACGVAAGLVLLGGHSVRQWAPLMRVDMLALLFDLGGVALAIAALRRPRLIHAAALAFALALYSKQTSIAAPAATFAVLIAVRPRLAFAGIATTAAIGLGALAWLTHATGGGFLRHVLLYNINRFDPSRLFFVMGLVLSHLGIAAIAFAGAWASLRRLRGAAGGIGGRARIADDPAAIGVAILLGYLAIATVMLAMLMKVGSNVNYFIEWSSVAAIFCGIGLRPVIAVALGEATGSPSPVLLFVIAVVMPFQLADMPDRNADRPEMAARARDYRPVVALIRASAKPVIADPMTLLIRSGRDVEWEPAIAAELAHTGVYDEAAFVAMIRARRFGFFALQGDPHSRLYRERYDPAVRAAIAAAYPVVRRQSDLILHFPPAQ